MHAVLLFSAALHAAMLGLIAAHSWRHWVEMHGAALPSVPRTIGYAGLAALAVAALGTILIWTARPFGVALMDGVLAGLVSGTSFLIYLAVWPLPLAADGSAPTLTAWRTAASFVALTLSVELIAVCFTVGMVGAG